MGILAGFILGKAGKIRRLAQKTRNGPPCPEIAGKVYKQV